LIGSRSFHTDSSITTETFCQVVEEMINAHHPETKIDKSDQIFDELWLTKNMHEGYNSIEWNTQNKRDTIRIWQMYYTVFFATSCIHVFSHLSRVDALHMLCVLFGMFNLRNELLTPTVTEPFIFSVRLDFVF